MTEVIRETVYDAVLPNLEHIITEDDEPVDNLFSAKQQRLLVEPLYTAWKPERPFLADANVGIFNSAYQPPIVPDAFLSLDVEPGQDLWKKENRSYFMWKFGKPPEIVVEVVSNIKGGETGKKFRKYAQIGAWFYAIYDPQCLLQSEALAIYQLSLGRYVPRHEAFFEDIGLGLTVWKGIYEEMSANWLRWCDKDGQVIPNGAEWADQEAQRADQEAQRADQEAQRAKQEAQRAKQEAQRADQEALRAEKLAAQLRALGIEPEL